jgi:peptidoglycan/LPS O-acetylase OafA/YrhL
MGLIRLALAMAVLLGHLPNAGLAFMGAGLAVQGFFIVSGFYMSLVLAGKYKDIKLFYSNRLLRLAPTYYVVMVLAALCLFGLDASATASTAIFTNLIGNPTTALITAFENIAVLGQDLLFWFTLDGKGDLVFNSTGAVPDPPQTVVAWQALLVPQSWSLSMELVFYSVAPFLSRLNWRALAGLVVASVSLRLAGHALPVNYGLWQARLFPTALFLFVLGMLSQRALPYAARFPKALGWLLSAGLLAAIVSLPMLELPDELARFLMYGLIAASIPFIFNAFSNIGIDRWIGDLSYPLYLTHLMVIGLVLRFDPPHAAWVAIGGSLALSMLLLIGVDRRVDRWRQRRVAANSPAPGSR